MSEPKVPNLDQDERWQLAKKIVASAPFQRAERLRSLLLFLVEASIRGEAAQLTEQQIGHKVFGKAEDYSPIADSSVRANARLLRLRLHEYYDGPGVGERLVLELPKGGYAPLFRAVEAGAAEEVAAKPGLATGLVWKVAGLVAAGLVCLGIGYWAGQRLRPAEMVTAPAWPLSEVWDAEGRTQIIISDINYQLFSILGNQVLSLEEYIGPHYPEMLLAPNQSEREARLTNHLSRTSFVSYADAVTTLKLVGELGGKPEKVWLRSARDVKIRDLAEGNLILVGSPASNLWASLYEEQLNFVERKTEGRKSRFENRKPAAGEAATYTGIRLTGTSGTDYATVALVPNTNGRGSVLMFQGLQQEGTEAAGRMLTTEEGRRQLRAALGLPASGPTGKVHFQVLLQSKAVGGSAATADVVATRRLQ